MNSLQSLIDKAEEHFDLTESSHQAALYELVDAITALDCPLDELNAEARQAPLQFKLAAKLIESRHYLEQLEQDLNIAVVFAMWGEQNRLQAKSADNPSGEDILRVKLDQLQWASDGTRLNWHLYAVDDGCPHGSGAMAQAIANDHALGKHVSVLQLADAVPTDKGPLAALKSVDDSRKGGAIIYGCMQALADGNDAVVYTDADNSVHLGQLGLLLRPFVVEGKKVVLGNRKHEDSVLVKQEGRWGIGIKLLRHMQRMVGEPIFSLGIRDTQAAFKLYEKSVLEKIISDPACFDFSFDTDWILAVIAMQEDFAEVPFAFIDSAAESASITQGPMTTWEALIQGLKKSVRKHGLPHNEAMARVLDEEIHSSKDLDILIDHLPAELEQAADSDLGNPNIMSPEAVQAWIQQRKKEEKMPA